ncbi:hypothetical protein [Actinokineospora fastidiosa]|uniref:hypothetical protein n=1 Tax=Actinokineospora fastidiosa TaxID=1816 RepID=UPI001E301662|nr:hypothetical protein [Actinokineospora fastidiosa]
MGIAVAAAVVMVALAVVTPASAQQQTTLSARAVPSSGPAGGTFQVEWTIAYPARACTTMYLSWAYGEYEQPRTDLSGAFSVPVPREAEQGTHPISLHCYNAKSGTRFTVRGVIPTTTNPPVTTTTRPPVTTTTRPPVVTRPPVTTTTPPVTTTTTTAPPTTTTTPPTTTDTPTTTATTADEPDDGGLTLDRETIQPGDPLSASGEGCEPYATVRLTSKGETVGETTADAEGAFTAAVEFTRVEPGRHMVVAECGVVLTGSVDQLVTSSTGGGSTALVVLVFFVLAGAAMIRFA